jgi:glycosyltransferase involved in cell wall biosynthesis
MSDTLLFPSPVVGSIGLAHAHQAAAQDQRVRVSGKFFRLGEEKWYLKGLTYGPFAPNSQGLFLPERPQVRRDFAHMNDMGANAIRVYHVPPTWLLDEALAHDIRVLIDIPWEKHRCFFEDWSSTQAARKVVADAARDVGNHPGVFAISVVNEFPNDVVRFYGAPKMEKFVDELLDSVKQNAPTCLATFANYPTTEFLSPQHRDFVSFNVYLDESQKLGAYLDRLQHMAGNTPLILGEYGQDSIRHGEQEQATALTTHLQQVFHHGLAGSFIFSYTDDWYTGGHQIEDWAFGITTKTRKEKLAATKLRKAWADVPRLVNMDSPKVSVVVCSYNGASTLEECLASLGKMNYPNYEVILVDDGSKDNTPEIAAKFPWVKNIRQVNRGLSVARNVGAQAATGSIVAYTDSDCVVDEDWLFYLVEAMRDQKVDAIGGPNIPPYTDSWTARCVAASPGGPSHVMIDDHRAEHVPGCNMAWDRAKLLALGGFDAQFRVAGDDVDVCWRWMDAGHSIGFAPGAMVWHKRRNTIRAYIKQQQGYGRSEAMLTFKHPKRFNLLNCSLWKGVIYGEGAVGLPTTAPKIFHGPQGAGLFQTIYRSTTYSPWAYTTIIEWYAAAAAVGLLSIVYWPLAVIVALMLTLSAAAIVRATLAAPLPRNAPWWCRLVTGFLYAAQPVMRGATRWKTRLAKERLPRLLQSMPADERYIKDISLAQRDMYWQSADARGREDLLKMLQTECAEAAWSGDFDNGWKTWDLALTGDRFHSLTIRTVTEELGSGKRFTRARAHIALSLMAKCVIAYTTLFIAASAATMNLWTFSLSSAFAAALIVRVAISRERCFATAARFLMVAGRLAGLNPVLVRPTTKSDIPVLLPKMSDQPKTQAA